VGAWYFTTKAYLFLPRGLPWNHPLPHHITAFDIPEKEYSVMKYVFLIDDLIKKTLFRYFVKNTNIIFLVMCYLFNGFILGTVYSALTITE
jgi:hypothetical protein